jgi:hypothetical protein
MKFHILIPWLLTYFSLGHAQSEEQTVLSNLSHDVKNVAIIGVNIRSARFTFQCIDLHQVRALEEHLLLTTSLILLKLPALPSISRSLKETRI